MSDAKIRSSPFASRSSINKRMDEHTVTRGWADALRASLMYANVPVGLIAVAFVLGTYALLGLPPSLPLLVLAFCGTFLVYQGERALFEAPEDAFNQPQRQGWVRRHRGFVRGASGVAAVAALAMLPLLRPVTLAVSVGLAGVSLLYVAPLLPGRRRLKTIWYVKPLAFSGAWAMGGVVLPVLEADAPLHAGVWLLVVYRFLFVWPNVLLADWADREGDARAGLRTVATEWSSRRLHGLAALAPALAVAGALGAILWYDSPRLLYLDAIGPALMLAAVGLRPGSHARFFYSFIIDALVAWPLLTWLAAP